MKDFLNDVIKIRNPKAGIYGFIFTGTYRGSGFNHFFPWLWNAGGSLLNEEGTKAAFNSEAGRVALQFIADLFNKYKVVPLMGLYDLNDDMPENLFMRGKVGVGRVRQLAIRVQRDEFPELKYGVIMPPYYKPGMKRYTFADWGYYTIAARSKHKEQSWEWLKYITSKKLTEDYVSRIGLMPARKDVKLYQGDPILGEFSKNIMYSKNAPIHPKLMETMEIYWSECERTLLGAESVPNALQKAEAGGNKLLAE